MRKTRDFAEAAAAADSVAPRGVPSLAHDVVLVGLDPDTGKPGYYGRIVTLALLVELSREGRLSVAPGRTVSVGAANPAPLGDPELDDALATVVAGSFGSKVPALLPYLPDAADVLRRMVADGELREESARKWGLLPTKRYVVTSPATREALVALIRGALLGQVVPDARTALLIALVRLVVSPADLVGKGQAREADRRATEFSEQMTGDERLLLSAIQQADAHSNDAGS